MNKPRLLAATFAVALLVGACSGSTPTSSTAALTAIPTPTPTPTAPALPSGPLFSLALPSFDLHNAPQLEATIPDTIAGQSMQKFSTDFARLEAAMGGASDTDKAFADVIRSLGKNLTDVNVAVGFSTGTPKFSILAIQIAGVDPARMSATLRLALRAQDITPTETTVGGKSVLQFSDPTQTDTTSYAYVKNDIVYLAQSTDAAAALSAVEALP